MFETESVGKHSYYFFKPYLALRMLLFTLVKDEDWKIDISPLHEREQQLLSDRARAC